MILHILLIPHTLFRNRDPVKDFEFLGDDEEAWQKEPEFLKHMEDHSSNNFGISDK